MIRAHRANLGVYNGVRMDKGLEIVRITCRNGQCTAVLHFDWQPRYNVWKLNNIIEHKNECFGLSLPRMSETAEEPKFCSSAYTANQVVRALLDDICKDSDMKSSQIASLVKAKGLYRREPPFRHYRSVRRELLRYISAYRAVNMAALEGYISQLREQGHLVNVFIENGVEMKPIRIKASRFIYNQEKYTYEGKNMCPFE